ncbi:(4Fe-4S)-binding protein [Spiractinospora alimapuensis]|uniref:ferredoxin n=1 Tax=Spiractinospora alimapuensis TaxID=2820884 RepID=UPI002ED0D801|nr:(4Fe-4S)-binding protein [Spiractinospora alimapuensis]
MRVTADTRVCVGAGMCVLTVPEVFDQSDEDGLVRVLLPDPRERVRDAVVEAVRLCPSRALAIDQSPAHLGNGVRLGTARSVLNSTGADRSDADPTRRTTRSGQRPRAALPRTRTAQVAAQTDAPDPVDGDPHRLPKFPTL